MKIYKGEEVIVRPPGDIRIIEGYEGVYCKCGNTLHIKTPEIKAWHPIECPECGHIVNLFCGKKGEKLGSDYLRSF